MIDPQKHKTSVLPMAAARGAGEVLPYRIELWDLPRLKVEKLLARASSAQLARAIFTAAQSEHLGRYIVLRRGKDVIAESP